ncbi:phytanoyl-CoA dioxygenase [Aureococcus anophagefferens]|nr:phytanoyl-CoA dioxygenase [Aureococcus anophagefferens]
MARRKVADLQARLARDGFVHYAASDAWCEAAASDARAALDAALAPGAWLPECLRPRVGTNIRTRTRRWDVAVDASAAVAAALSVVASDPGAPAQQVHCDTAFSPGPPLYTFLVALQDVSEGMGPTSVWPGTHAAAFHARSPAERARHLALEAPAGGGAARRGDALLFDSRVYHGGGANGEARRLLLSATFKSAAAHAGADAGTTDSLLPHLAGRWTLGDFLARAA